MTAVSIPAYGTVEVRSDASVRSPAPYDVVVRVHAAGINPLDHMMVDGYGGSVLQRFRPAPLPFTPGRECSGEIAAVGSEVWDYKVYSHRLLL